MPSSTSSSEAGRWRRIWFVASALVLTLMGGWELYWRSQGFEPRINNDESLWALARTRVESEPEGVVLVGSSRLQVAIDPDAFVRATDWPRPIQLSIAMGASTPVLRDLARTDAASQLVVFEVHPMIFFEATRQLDARVVRYLDRYAAFTPADAIEARLRTLSQRALVSSLPPLFPHQLIAAYRNGRRPRPAHTSFDPERFGGFDSASIEHPKRERRLREALWKNWRGRPTDPDGVAHMTELLGGFVAAIRARGGDVVFVRMPTAGPNRAREKRLFPRKEYWDRFAAGIDAVSVHFEDHPELRDFDPPDGEHLDVRDTEAFSSALGGILVRKLAERNGT